MIQRQLIQEFSEMKTESEIMKKLFEFLTT
jgi:hypothetical protein